MASNTPTAIGRLNAQLATATVTGEWEGEDIALGEVIIEGDYNATVDLSEDGKSLATARGDLDMIRVKIRVDDEPNGKIDMPPEFARTLRDALTDALGARR
jgi:hypothetical protein